MTSPFNTKHAREALGRRVAEALGPGAVRQHAKSTGVNHETLRRWLSGHSAMPAWFVALVAERSGVPAQWLLLGKRADDAGGRLPALTQESLERLHFLVKEIERALTAERGEIGAGHSHNHAQWPTSGASANAR